MQFYQISVTESLLHAFYIKDKLGLNWQMLPEAVNEDDCRFLSQRWLSMLAIYCVSSISATRVLHAGNLSKRGQRNNALRKRWFVLTTDRVVSFFFCQFLSLIFLLQLRYYKDDAFKGEINLNKVATINQNKVAGH